MTTTVKIHVGGQYEAVVRQTHKDGTISEVKIGPDEEKMLSIPHPVKEKIEIIERYVGGESK